MPDYAVVIYDEQEQEDRRLNYTVLPTAVRIYTRMLGRHAHVALVEAGGLPGMEDRVIAERFAHQRRITISANDNEREGA